ncbi:hypothetical protein AVEN_209326-1 [Araneus ventricosus]|uniref:Uncharacterized protein n=1 Tax=Araneus ventricosus TaxID=182803 RepID=A0A4Y2CBC1_ARAVE|nr:hypothetical protein AVEN_209326-1 [Araneus ventricosus]
MPSQGWMIHINVLCRGDGALQVRGWEVEGLVNVICFHWGYSNEGVIALSALAMTGYTSYRGGLLMTALVPPTVSLILLLRTYEEGVYFHHTKHKVHNRRSSTSSSGNHNRYLKPKPTKVKTYKKEGLILVTKEIGENVPPTTKICDLKNILNSDEYEGDPDFDKGILENAVTDRKLQEEKEIELKKRIKKKNLSLKN